MTPTSLIIRKEDLDFWNINELLLEPCCALKYFPDIEVLRWKEMFSSPHLTSPLCRSANRRPRGRGSGRRRRLRDRLRRISATPG